MKNIKMNHLTFGALFLIGGLSLNSHAGNLTKAHKGDSGMNRINEAFLKGDMKAMTGAMKEAFLNNPHDEILQGKIYALLARAYAEYPKEGLAADNALPEDLTAFRITVRKRGGDTPKYSIKISGSTRDEDAIEQVKVTRFPGEVVLDKKAGVGDFDVGIGKLLSKTDLYAESKRTLQVPNFGLYLIHFEFKSKKAADTWVILDPSLIAEAGTSIVEPEENSKVSGKDMLVRWTAVKDSIRPYEHASIYLSVARMEPPKYEYDGRWETHVAGSEAGQVKCPEKLEPGNYRVGANVSFARRFGEIQVRRENASSQLFVVDGRSAQIGDEMKKGRKDSRQAFFDTRTYLR